MVSHYSTGIPTNTADDVHVKSTEEDCYVCLQFTPEQKHKLVPKSKKKEKNEATVITKRVEVSLLGSGRPPQHSNRSLSTK